MTNDNNDHVEDEICEKALKASDMTPGVSRARLNLLDGETPHSLNTMNGNIHKGRRSR